MKVPLAAVERSKNGEVSCSIEETNRIRKLLGLRPLDIDSTPASRHEKSASDRNSTVEDGSNSNQKKANRISIDDDEAMDAFGDFQETDISNWVQNHRSKLRKQKTIESVEIELDENNEEVVEKEDDEAIDILERNDDIEQLVVDDNPVEFHAKDVSVLDSSAEGQKLNEGKRSRKFADNKEKNTCENAEKVDLMDGVVKYFGTGENEDESDGVFGAKESDYMSVAEAKSVFGKSMFSRRKKANKNKEKRKIDIKDASEADDFVEGNESETQTAFDRMKVYMERMRKGEGSARIFDNHEGLDETEKFRPSDDANSVKSSDEDDEREVREAVDRARRIVEKERENKEVSAEIVAQVVVKTSHTEDGDELNEQMEVMNEGDTETDGFLWIPASFAQENDGDGSVDEFVDNEISQKIEEKVLRDWKESKNIDSSEKPGANANGKDLMEGNEFVSSSLDENVERSEVKEHDDVHKMHEKYVGSGLAAALNHFREQGELVSKGKGVKQYGRATDKSFSFADAGDGEEVKKDSIRLEYVDEFGRKLTPKEAFRHLSYKFHGKPPSKNKQEKRLQRYLEEQKLKQQMSNTDTPLNTLAALKQETAASGQAFVRVSGSAALRSANASVVPMKTSDYGVHHENAENANEVQAEIGQPEVAGVLDQNPDGESGTKVAVETKKRSAQLFKVELRQNPTKRVRKAQTPNLVDDAE
uniref:SART-1 family protein n=1 Tax=Timspurckia oligopyrenoides TaxID=708627 RepID=A0A7S1EUI3_9RHOD|mmetsp:Transcript_8853/g.15941  ORF Transcript_8853/g.15941 Transcript_8853/m.15941 type:complete len:703 (+) Transcript_8853:50-2158(+)